jgi:hypothetical protein
MLRLLLLVLGLIGGLLSAAVYDAASSAHEAHTLLRASQAIDQPPLRREILNRAAEAIENSWSNTAYWHAGAAEALSAVYASRTAEENGNMILAAKSVAAAQRSVELSPVQARAWTRLAAFAQIGTPGSPCSVERCLEMSWRAGRIIDPQSACTRLRIAAAEGLLTGPGDERIAWYLSSGAGPLEAARCLDFLPANVRFRVLLHSK